MGEIACWDFYELRRSFSTGLKKNFPCLQILKSDTVNIFKIFKNMGLYWLIISTVQF